jgi:hypothetical protein
MCEGVFNVYKSRLWVRDNPHLIREREYGVHFNVSVWAEIFEDIVLGPCLLPDRLTIKRCHDFVKTVILGLLLAVNHGFWFEHGNSSAL